MALALWTLLLAGLAHADPPAPPADPPAPGGRLEFDPRLVQGSTATGSVVLLHRRARPLPPLVPVRTSFRDRIVLPLLGPAPWPADAPTPEATP